MGHDSDGKFNNGHANELAIKLESHTGGRGASTFLLKYGHGIGITRELVRNVEFLHPLPQDLN